MCPMDDVKRKMFKINKVIWATKSRVIHVLISISKQYQIIISSLAWVKLIKTKVVFRYHTKCVSKQVSYSNIHYHIQITKSKVIHVQIPVLKWEKTKKWVSGTQNGAIRVLVIGTGFMDYISRQEGVKIGAALGI